MMSISSWLDYPVRNPLKILGTLVTTLEEKGVKNVSLHLVGVRSWGTLSFLLKKSPFTEQEIRRVRDFCELRQLIPSS